MVICLDLILTLKLFQSCTARSRSFIKTLCHSNVHISSCSSWRPWSNRIIQFTCNAVSMHLNHRKIVLLSTHCGVGSPLCMRNINYKTSLTGYICICYLSKIKKNSRSTHQKLENNIMNIVCQSCKQ
jgi:hypothetical protein